MIGEKTKKVLGVKIVYKKNVAERKFKGKSNKNLKKKKRFPTERKIDEHLCIKNFEGSSKAMEPFAATKLIVNTGNPDFEKCNVRVAVLAGDDDSATISSVQQAANYEVKKISDLNHTKKSFGNKLWKLKSTYTELTANVIKYFKFCFEKAITRNKNNPKVVSDALLNIPNHAFGSHDK